RLQVLQLAPRDEHRAAPALAKALHRRDRLRTDRPLLGQGAVVIGGQSQVTHGHNLRRALVVYNGGPTTCERSPARPASPLRSSNPAERLRIQRGSGMVLPR